MSNKLQILLDEEKNIFTSSDLAVLWEIQNKNTLLTTLSRYEGRGYLHRIYKGLYSKKSLEGLNPYEMGCAIAGPSGYVSAETVLAAKGVIMQEVGAITLYGRESKDLEIGDQRYLVRYMNPKYLLNRIGIRYIDNYYIASPERAMADIQYSSPDYYFDNAGAVDGKQLAKLKHELNYPK